jgi:hypothetical protein
VHLRSILEPEDVVRVDTHTWFGVTFWITLIAAFVVILKLSR